MQSLNLVERWAEDHQKTLMAQLTAERDRADELQRVVNEKDSEIQNNLTLAEAQELETQAVILEQWLQLSCSDEVAQTQRLTAEEHKTSLKAELTAVQIRADELERVVKEQEAQELETQAVVLEQWLQLRGSDEVAQKQRSMAEEQHKSMLAQLTVERFRAEELYCGQVSLGLQVSAERERADQGQKVVEEKDSQIRKNLSLAKAQHQEMQAEILELRRSDEVSQKQRLMDQEEQHNSLMAQLMTARERADDLRKVVKEKDSQLGLAEQSRELRGRALKEKEGHLLHAEVRQQQMGAEIEELRRRLRGSHEAEQENALKAEEQQNCLTAQLMASRDRVDELRKVVTEKESQIKKGLHLAEQCNDLKRALKDKEARLHRVEAQQLAIEAEVVEVRQRLRDSDEAAQQNAQKPEELQNSLMIQLMAARGRADELRKVVKEKDLQLQNDLGLKEQSKELRRVLKDKEEQLFRAEARRREMEAEVAELRRRQTSMDDASKEIARLRRELQEARASKLPRASSQDEMVRQVAALECLPLKRAGKDERPTMKKRLLLKWHPDKQISTDNASFATQVTQELQNRPEWD